MAELSEIVEVVECGLSYANKYLANGYVLINVTNTTSEQKRDDGQFWIRRRNSYILGRTANTERYTVPVQQKQEGA